MKLISTLLLTSFLLPTIKDTVKPVFNMYAVLHDTSKAPNKKNKKETPYRIDVPLPKQNTIQVKVQLGSQAHPFKN